MQGIEFEEDKSYQNFTAEQQASALRPSTMVRLLLKLGIPDPAVANYILLGVAGIFFGITIFLYAGIFAEQKPIRLTAEQQEAQLRFMGGI